MTFILRFVAIVFIFAFVVYVLKSLARLSFNIRNTAKEMNKMRESATTRQSAKSTTMMRCVACGAFVAERDAVQLSSAGSAQVFCSHECLQLHAKSA